MIISASKSEAQRPKSSQRGTINAWYLKVCQNLDQNNQSSQNVQQNVQNNIEYNQNSKMIVQTQGTVRSTSNIKQSSQVQIRSIPLQQINNQTKVNKSSPERNSPQSCSNLDESPFPIYQKSKRPPSQLMHILYNKNKNIRQLYASQLGNNVQQDEKHRVKMKEIKEKQLRANSERNKKISSLIQEENQSNINTNNLWNQKSLIITNNTNNINMSQSVQKQQTIQDFHKGSQDLNENKYRVFADYQSYLASLNNNNTNVNTNSNINSRNLQYSQQSQYNINTQLNTSRSIITHLPTQTALNRVIKQQLNQIQQGMGNQDNQNRNITSVKRASSREQFQQPLLYSHRGFTRTSSMICTTQGPQTQVTKQDKDSQTNLNCLNIFDENQIQLNKNIDGDQQQINLSQLLNALPLETEMTPSISSYRHRKNSQQEDTLNTDTLSRKARQISNPSLRKKFQTSSGLLMKNFLLKEKKMKNNKQNKIDGNEDTYFGNKLIHTDESSRQKNKNSKQKSVGDLKQTNDGNLNQIKYTTVDQQIIQDKETTNPLVIQNFMNTYQNFQNINDNQSNQQHINKKFDSSYSPIKRSQTQYNQFTRTNSQNLQNSQRQQTANFIEGDSLIEKYSNDNINPNLQENCNFKQINSRPSSSLSKSQNQDLLFQKVQSQIQRGQCPSIRNRPRTAKIPNIASIASQVYQNRLQNSNQPSQIIKPKVNIQLNQQKNLNTNNFGDLKSWENSMVDETSQIEIS